MLLKNSNVPYFDKIRASLKPEAAARCLYLASVEKDQIHFEWLDF